MDRISPEVDGKPICPFNLELYRVLDIYDDPKNEPGRYVELSIVFDGEQPCPKVQIPMSQINNFNWSSLDHRASFTPHISQAKASRFLSYCICDHVKNLPVAVIYRLHRPGFYKINGTAVFCTGEEVIRPPASNLQEPEIECVPMSQQLDFNPALSEDEAVSEVLNLISLFPNPGRVILSQVLVSLLCQAYEDAGEHPSFCVFLYGRTGTQKTTISSFLTQIYNRSNGITSPPRLNASQASAVELLLEVTDQVQIFDDLFPAVSGQVRKKQEETLSEITRYIGDGTVPARIKGSKVRTGHPRCGVLFTGEYLIGNGSDAARLLPVEMTKPDTSALRFFQERPLIVSTFYRNFIVWSVNNYDEIVDYLKKWWDKYCKTELGIHDRLRKTHFFLNSAYALLLQYCGDKGVLSQEEIARFHDDFLTQLTKLVREQNERVCPASSVPFQQGNVLKRIKELYRSNQFSIPKDKSQFNGSIHDGVIHTNHLCLRPEALLHFFPSMTPDEIAAELEAKGALNKSKSGYKRKISEAKGNYFYWIRFSCL